MIITWQTLALNPGGRSLIEASAGTGKTWTMTALYLRLLLEERLAPRQIVVTTFTEAAAEELRERLRSKLEQAIALCQASESRSGPGGQDADMAWLKARWGEEKARQDDGHRLALALAAMDGAPVGTLHSLCRRILADHPFACGTTFALGELVAADALRHEVAADLWRCLQQGAESEPLLQAMQQAELMDTLNAVDKLHDGIKRCLAPGVLIEAVPPQDLAPASAELAQMEGWPQRLRALADRPELFPVKSAFFKNRVWHQVADFIVDPWRLPEEWACDSMQAMVSSLQKQTSKLLTNAVKKNPDMQAALQFSQQCLEIIARLRDARKRHFWHELMVRARGMMQERLRARNQLNFDALLERVHAALGNERSELEGQGRPLADALWQAWPVALVDEFQDTDGVQYGILEAIYSRPDGSPRGRLVMIGDPKQAIYRFRGGDINAYQRAAEVVPAGDRLALATNRRSTHALVTALNQFHAASGPVLSAREEEHPIRYLAVQALKDNAEYTIDGEPCRQPLVIQYRSEEGKRPVGERRSEALRLCAAEITALLQSQHYRIKGRPVTPGDIAVLLPTKHNITELHGLLRAHGVPCITSSQESVFATDMAQELQVVLHAVAHEHDMAALRAAAATRLWGWSYGQLLECDEHAPAWKELVQLFQGWHRDWQQRGVQQVVEALLVHMAPRFLATAQGERALTDLRHLGELLAQQAATQGGAEELLAWLRAKRNQSNDAGDALADAARLRIEADGDKVRLLTLHGSKGLEFPIVFLPLMWDHDEYANTSGLYLTSDRETGRRLLDVTEEAREKERQEEQDERFRVLYVALTRAIYACHLYALPPQRAKNGNTDKPAEGTERSALDVMLARMKPQPPSAALQQQAANIAWLEGWQLPEVGRYVPDEGKMARGPARSLPIAPSRPLAARHSFTSLLSAAVVSSPLPLDKAQPHPGFEALASLRGPDFGNAVHKILERRQLQVPLQEQHELVRRCLFEWGALGMDKADAAPSPLVTDLAQRLQAVLETPLAGNDATGPRLFTLKASDLRAELGFSFTLAGVDLSAWRGLAERHGAAGLVPTSTKIIKGMMRGSIDLVFQHDGRYHLLDYKSNFLGETLDHYQGTALDEAMGAHHYPFQALLYAVALERYLRQRIRDYKRDEHLGECWYLFIRAVGLDLRRAPGAGIWRHRFDDALLDAVGELLAAADLLSQAS